MSNEAGGAFRAAMTGADQPADTSVDTGGQVDVFADMSGSAAQEGFSDAPQRVVPVIDGRPAPKEADPAPDAMVPSWRLREITEERARERTELERVRKEADELRAYRQQQEDAAKPKPDMFGDPDQWATGLREEMKGEFGKTLTPVQERFERFVETTSRRMAVREHGEEAVSGAYDLLKAEIAAGRLNGQAIQQALKQSDDPFGDIMDFAKKHKVQNEIGNDPAAYREKLRQEILAETNGDDAEPQAAPAAPRLVTEGPRPAAPKTIPSLNRTASAQSGDEPASGGDAFRQALRSRR